MTLKLKKVCIKLHTLEIEPGYCLVLLVYFNGMFDFSVEIQYITNKIHY